jgi:hypothetical protein
MYFEFWLPIGFDADDILATSFGAWKQICLVDTTCSYGTASNFFESSWQRRSEAVRWISFRMTKIEKLFGSE